jgi:hypothetical protein
MRSVVQLYPGPPLYRGAVAQLGERLVCNQEATGSIPVSSTRIHGAEMKTFVRFVDLFIGVAVAIGLLALRLSSFRMYRDSDTKVQMLFGKDRWWT